MKDYFTHVKITLPRTQFFIIAKQGIKSFYHCSIGGWNNCWMKKVNDICNGWTKTFDLSRGKTTDFCKYLFLTCSRKNCFKKCTKFLLVGFILVNVRDTKFRLPEEGMCRT